MLNKLKELALGQSGVGRYFRNTSWLFGGHIVRVVVGVLVSVAVARHLGPDDFGVYNFAYAIVSLLTVLSTLGLQHVLRRELVSDEERRGELLGSCIVMTSLASLVIFAALLSAVALLPDQRLGLVLIVIGATVLLSPFNLINVWFQADVQGKLSAIALSASLLIAAALKLLAIFLEAGLLTFAYLSLIELTILAVWHIMLYRKYYGSLTCWSATRGRCFRLLKESWPMIFAGLATVLYMRVDQIMLRALVDDVAVGEYSAATRISSVWHLLPITLASSLFPAIVNARKASDARYRQRLQHYFDLSAALAYFTALGTSIFAPWVITLLFGEAYEASGPIAAVHVWSCLFIFVGVARVQYLTVESQLSVLPIFTAIGCGVNLLLNWWLIPLYSGMGAAIATVISQFTSVFVTSFLFKRTRTVGMVQLRALLFMFRVPGIIKAFKAI